MWIVIIAAPFWIAIAWWLYSSRRYIFEQKAAFSRICSGPPEDATVADLELVEPLIKDLKDIFPPTLTRTETPGGTMPLMSLTGHLLPHSITSSINGLPFIRVADNKELYVPCFSAVEKLKEFMGRIKLPYDGAQEIEDERTFLSAVPLELDGLPVKIIIDPHFTEDGKLRFMEVTDESP